MSTLITYNLITALKLIAGVNVKYLNKFKLVLIGMVCLTPYCMFSKLCCLKKCERNCNNVKKGTFFKIEDVKSTVNSSNNFGFFSPSFRQEDDTEIFLWVS